MTDTNKVLRAYVECALWSSVDDHGEPIDAAYDALDIAPETLAEMASDVEDFVEANGADLIGMDEDQIGHDFWLTRNRHGAGFWDRGLGERGERLTKMAHSYGEANLYVGTDGKIIYGE